MLTLLKVLQQFFLPGEKQKPRAVFQIHVLPFSGEKANDMSSQ